MRKPELLSRRDLEIPTGDKRRELGAGVGRTFLPIWAQKTIGKWTVHGGGGYGWIGYHRSSAERGYGAPGMISSMLMLLYVCARFGFEFAGWAGAAGAVVLFGLMEAIITWKTEPQADKPST